MRLIDKNHYHSIQLFYSKTGHQTSSSRYTLLDPLSLGCRFKSCRFFSSCTTEQLNSVNIGNFSWVFLQLPLEINVINESLRAITFLFLTVSHNMHYNFVKKEANKYKYYSKHSCKMLSLVFNKPFLRKSSLSKLQDYIKSLSFYSHLHSVNYLNKRGWYIKINTHITRFLTTYYL